MLTFVKFIEIPSTTRLLLENRRFLLISFKKFPDVNTCIGVRILSDFFRCTAGNDCSASCTALRTNIYNIICCFDDIQIVLNDNDGVAAFSQSSEDFCQFVNIGKMKTGCRLIQNVNSTSCAALAELCCQFDALCLTAG